MTSATTIGARAFGLPAATTPTVEVERGVRLPAPDGVPLVTDLYLSRPLVRRPVILIRSPYGRAGVWSLAPRLFAERGFHAVIQSCRGTFGSGGQLSFSAEATDGRVAADWIVAQKWSNGDIGTFGPSYLGFVQWALASTRPPQLKAMAIQIMSADRSRTYYPGGVFALDNALTWTYTMAHVEKGLRRLFAHARQRWALAPLFDRLPLLDLDVAATGHPVAYYRDWLAHQPGDEFWRALDLSPFLADHRVPTSFVGAWYDYFLPHMLEDQARVAGAGTPTRMLIGPWTHASWRGGMAGIREALAWFEAHLRGGGLPAGGPIRFEVMGGGGWRETDTWPPAHNEVQWYLQPAGGLSRAPAPPSEPDRHTYDPSDPPPAVGGTSLSSNSGPKDNRALEARPDVLTYTTTPLERPLVIAGPVRAEVYLESSTPDFDLFARICDVHPGGRSVNVCDGIIRCGPGAPLPVRVDLWPTAYRFAAGHRLRLQVSAGSHPRFARNLGSGEPLATGQTIVPSERAVFHDPVRSSAVFVPVVADA